MLIFNAERHEYTLDGKVLPSVTTVLQDVGIIDYSRIPRETRESALHRGRCVHVATQYDDERYFGICRQPLDEASIDPEHMPYVQTWRRFRREKKFRADLIEHRAWHPQYRYAGTLDRTGFFEDHPAFRVCLDIKSGTAEPWVQIQTASYAAFFEHPRQYLRIS